MAITLADFTKIWASTSPLTPYSFSESNYKEGWNFIGGTPPSRQMWDSIQNQNDEKLKYIVDNYLPLDGTSLMTGAVGFDSTGQVGFRGETHTSPPDVCKQLIMSSTDIDHWTDEGGAKISLHTYDTTQTNVQEDGSFNILATDGTNSSTLQGKPNGILTWDGKSVGTNKWTVTELTPKITNYIASWGFCRVIYNQVIGIITLSGLRIDVTVTTPTILFDLPFTVTSTTAGCFFVTSSSPVKIYSYTVDSNRLQINGINSVESNYIYGYAVVPIA